MPTSLSLWQAMRYWLRLGLVSFGGPGGAIGIMHLELVERLRWISEPRFLHALNYTMVLPGPEAQQLATYIGWLLHGRLGGLIAGILFVAPSLLMIVVLAWLYLAFGDIEWVAASLYGVKPAVTAVILYAIWRIGRRVMRNALLWAVMIAAFAGLYVFHLPFPLIIISAGGSGLVGALGQARLGRAVRSSNRNGGRRQFRIRAFNHPARSPVAVCGRSRFVDRSVCDCPFDRRQRHTDGHVGVFQQGRCPVFRRCLRGSSLRISERGRTFPMDYGRPDDRRTCVAGIDSWAAGDDHLLRRFRRGWEGQLLGPDQMVAAGILAAAVAAWYTFLPSFLFIFIGAPYIEQTRHRPAFTAPLTAITAAVVGVMLNLAVMFAGHVIWTHGWEAPPDFNMVLMTGLALLALSAGRVPVVPVMVTCALTGILLTELGPMVG